MAHTALLVVHGIGAQEPGETRKKLADGLRRIDRGVPPEIADGTVITVGGQPIRLYEVYWADILKGDRTRGAFQMDELQSVSWFPWFNFRRGNYRPGSYSLLKLTWWWVVLPIFNFFVLFAYHGAGFFAQIFTGDRGVRPLEPGGNNVVRAPRKLFGSNARLTVVDRILDEYAGDVFSYVNSAGQAFYRAEGEPPVPPEIQRAYAGIVQRVYDQLLKADADGCSAIQIVAHSLGTVVTYHALTGFSADPARPDTTAIRTALAKVRCLYTIGSPLEKIRFFWPRIMPVTSPRSDMTLRWQNFVSFFDPVSGWLRSFDDWGHIANRRLLGGGFFRGHVVYERSPVFLCALAEGLSGRSITLQRSLSDRMWDILLLLGETLSAPFVLLITLAVGAMLFALVAALIPFLLSLPLRPFLARELWSPVVDRVSLGILALMVITFLITPILRARTVHALYWAQSPDKRG
ncbi:MAG TPA: hypothetical protein VF456_17915 [Vicinamibacterales bacterium]